MVAAAITGGEIEIKCCVPEHLTAVIAKLRDSGVEVEELNPSTLLVRQGSDGLKACDVTTEPHPQFPDRHAGAVYGLDDAGRGRIEDRRDHL